MIKVDGVNRNKLTIYKGRFFHSCTTNSLLQQTKTKKLTRSGWFSMRRHCWTKADFESIRWGAFPADETHHRWSRSRNRKPRTLRNNTTKHSCVQWNCCCRWLSLSIPLTCSTTESIGTVSESGEIRCVHIHEHEKYETNVGLCKSLDVRRNW